MSLARARRRVAGEQRRGRAGRARGIGASRRRSAVDPAQVARGDLDHRGDVGRVPPARRRRTRRGPARRAASAVHTRGSADDDGRLRRRPEPNTRRRPSSTSVSWPDSMRSSRSRRGRGRRVRSSRGLRSRMREVRHALELQRERVGVDQGRACASDAPTRRRRRERAAAQLRASRRTRSSPVAAALDVHRQRLAGRRSRAPRSAWSMPMNGETCSALSSVALHRPAGEHVGVALAPRRVRDLGDDGRSSLGRRRSSSRSDRVEAVRRTCAARQQPHRPATAARRAHQRAHRRAAAAGSPR